MSGANLTVDQLVPAATIVGNRVELTYASHGDAIQALRVIRGRLAQRDEMLAAMRAAVAFCESRGGRWADFEAQMRSALANVQGGAA